MKKALSLVLVVAFMAAMVGCGGSSGASKSPEMPALKGSQAYDIVTSLDERGISQPDTQHTDDGLEWTTATTKYSYDICANKDHEVAYAEFFVLSKEDADGFLKFCATIPYDTATPDDASAWVVSNIGTEATTTFGDATYTLSIGTTGPILVIEAIGYEDYILSKIPG